MELLQQMLPLKSLSHPAAIASLLLLVVLFLYWYGMRGFADLKKLNVPGPKPVPFLGNYFELGKYNGLHLMFFDYVKKYGKVFAVCLGSRPTLVVAEPELVKQIMIKDFPTFRNRFQPRKMPHPMNKNLLDAKDETWKRIRNTLTPTFSAGKMKLMVPLIEKSCDTLVEKLEKIADSGEFYLGMHYFSGCYSNRRTQEVLNYKQKFIEERILRYDGVCFSPPPSCTNELEWISSVSQTYKCVKNNITVFHLVKCVPFKLRTTVAKVFPFCQSFMTGSLNL